MNLMVNNTPRITRVLALDPGYDRLGVAILERQSGKEVLLYSSCILTNKNESLTERLLEIGNAVETLLVTHAPDAVAIETLFFNKNIKTAIGVAQARGIIIFLAKKAGCSVYEFGPQEIKVAVTGYGKSDKNAVIDMVKRLIIGAPKTALDDEYDAIAVGITALAHHGR
jgi:crossover junction endodeoxyribonuclease RuvC